MRGPTSKKTFPYTNKGTPDYAFLSHFSFKRPWRGVCGRFWKKKRVQCKFSLLDLLLFFLKVKKLVIHT
jgi:hypothetical protein